ncbi:serine/threonine-protein kinase, partial [Frankia sp. AgKG'84/4]|uniref:serine/threonine-protein kinase n=1 Tax=Frankia sp. AgKG'84/4 TaxID=573490 RepID=UPI00202A6151
MVRKLGSSYTLESRVGRGGMGEVWRGHDEAGNELAFKLLLPHFTSDPGVVARFMRERAILIRVQSPFVVAIHDLVAERGELAIVMEFVEGSDLRHELVRRRTLPPGEAVGLIVDILTGLATAHRLGIVHRDLKPENVLLDRRDGTSRPKVSDFGVAGLMASATRLTIPGGMLGTPLYMAPESVDGGVVGPAADIYAAGTMLYEMLCGVAPFAGREMLSILRAHADLVPGRPPGVPDEVWAVVAAMLAKNPADRPGTDRLRALLPALTGLPAAPAMVGPPASSRSAPHSSVTVA